MTRRRYMMATAALHNLGDISRDEPHLCIIDGEERDDYVGRWVEGFGFVNVRFPKATTRDLTAEEIAEYDGAWVGMNGEPMGQIRLGAGATKRPASTTDDPQGSSPGSGVDRV